MENKFIASSECWYIIRVEGNVYHGKLEKDGILETIHPVETFNTESEWKTALTEAGVFVPEFNEDGTIKQPEATKPIRDFETAEFNPVIKMKEARIKRLEEFKNSIK